MKYLLMTLLLMSCAATKVKIIEKEVKVIPNVLLQQDKVNACINSMTDKFLNMGLKPDLGMITDSCHSTYTFFRD